MKVLCCASSRTSVQDYRPWLIDCTHTQLTELYCDLARTSCCSQQAYSLSVPLNSRSWLFRAGHNNVLSGLLAFRVLKVWSLSSPCFVGRRLREPRQGSNPQRLCLWATRPSDSIWSWSLSAACPKYQTNYNYSLSTGGQTQSFPSTIHIIIASAQDNSIIPKYQSYYYSLSTGGQLNHS